MNEEHVASYYLFMCFNFCSPVTAHIRRIPRMMCRNAKPQALLFYGGSLIFSCVSSELPHYSCMQSPNSTRKFSLWHLTVNAERRKVIKIKSNYMMFWDEKVDITYSLHTHARNHVHMIATGDLLQVWHRYKRIFPLFASIQYVLVCAPVRVRLCVCRRRRVFLSAKSWLFSLVFCLFNICCDTCRFVELFVCIKNGGYAVCVIYVYTSSTSTASVSLTRNSFTICSDCMLARSASYGKWYPFVWLKLLKVDLLQIYQFSVQRTLS